MKIKTKKDRRDRIHLRSRKRITGSAERPRLTVFRSISHIYVQVIDDLAAKTVAAASTADPAMKGKLTGATRGGNISGAKMVGQAIAERLLSQGIQRVVFDRGGFLYHGRVKAVADAAREAGLKF